MCSLMRYYKDKALVIKQIAFVPHPLKMNKCSNQKNTREKEKD